MDVNHYIDNDRFELLISEYQDNRDRQILDVITSDYFYVLAYNLIKMSRFRLIEEEDALQEAAIICLKRLDNFDPNRGKAFNFFTTLIMNQLKGMYKRNKSFHVFRWQYLYEYACERTDNPFWKSVVENMNSQRALDASFEDFEASSD